jgi:hypothetical protein
MKNLLKILTLIFLILNISSCSAINYIKDKDKIKVSIKTQTKLDNILESFYNKLDKKYLENSKKIFILEKINSKIETIKK